jgi:protein tyrosine/serine phosphatase
MHLQRTQLRNLAALLAATLCLAASVSAQTKPRLDASKIKIKNFGRTNDNYFRGAQPDNGDYADLAAMGVRTVIDLTKDGREDEARLVKASGMTFYRIPLTTSEAPSNAAVTQFLKLVNDPGNWPVYVHCQGGRHRTGAMTAVYRMTQDGWTADRAYQEMKQYHFEGFPGHPELKTFVYGYYTQFAQARPANATLKSEAAVGTSK